MPKKPFLKRGQQDIPKPKARTENHPGRHTGHLAQAVDALTEMHQTQKGETTRQFRIPRKDEP